MKLTKEKLKKIIKEELASLNNENIQNTGTLEARKQEMNNIMQRLGVLQAELESTRAVIENEPLATTTARKKIAAITDEQLTLISQLNALFPPSAPKA